MSDIINNCISLNAICLSSLNQIKDAQNPNVQKTSQDTYIIGAMECIEKVK